MYHHRPPITIWKPATLVLNCLDYTTKGEVKLEMQKYVENMIDESLIYIKKSQVVASPETKNVFNVGGSKPLNKSKVVLFYTTVARCLFLCKRSRPDINLTIAVLRNRVKHPN